MRLPNHISQLSAGHHNLSAFSSVYLEGMYKSILYALAYVI